ncbi:hypothetical protein [Oceanobacillus neutriphilus]|uniref:DNA-binding protein n=1 Tax=Oceanobacillus neutriphilus TaxID=531815 RepID=A0ABQ2P222_9BACI|nr:hypothetical protein [Oceanobacillus neutriphilus]GGP16207.1 hypothetical protein GCM10011346_47260 [Oceanobacillus neutriphilus]
MNHRALILHILRNVKNGSYLNRTTIEIAMEHEENVKILNAFRDIDRNGLLNYKTVAEGNKEIIGITAAGERFLRENI